MNYWKQSTNNIYVAAHRGWSTDYPENTMLAYEKAIEIGVDQIEIDVRITKDGELVLIHDATVDRTTDGTGKVCDMTLEELRALDAGSWKDEKFKGCRIPTLIEFMELIKDLPEMTVDFELKEYPVEGWEEISYSVCDRVMAIIDEYGYTDRCVINTFSAKLHEYICEKYGKKYRQHVYYPIAHMGETKENPYEYGYCVCMFSSGKENPYGFIATNREFAEMKEKYGIQTWAGAGVKDAETVDMAIERGSELITCNNPDVVLALLRERGKHK
ncbi:MAG: glycerophosphodiester phosphodiesterase [Clostridia bacterium]|nr:glycerophosphodiester phosphodiesterase [Clostridia bacterium]